MSALRANASRTAADRDEVEQPAAKRRRPGAIASQHDGAEAQARAFAGGARWGGPLAPAAAFPLSDARADVVERGIAGSGEPLDRATRAAYEPGLGLDLGAVRVHDDAAAAAANRELRTRAFTVGSDIALAGGASRPEVLGHELAHVAQQSATGTPLVAAMPDIGVWDVVRLVSPTTAFTAEAVAEELSLAPLGALELVGRALLGDTVFDVLQSFASGFADGIEHAPAEQIERIRRKYADFGLADAGSFLKGFGLGILEGLWHALKGLVEGIIGLLKLPFALAEFLQQLPLLAAKYAVKLYSLSAEGGPLQKALDRLRAAWEADPAAVVEQARELLDEVRLAALAFVRGRGEQAARDLLGFLVKAWQTIGEEVGDVVGQVLFQILLFVATDAIGNLVTKAGELVAPIARGVMAAFRALGELIGEAVTWVEGLIGRMAGTAGELLESLGGVLRELRDLFVEIEANPEVQAAEERGAAGAGEAVTTTQPPVAAGEPPPAPAAELAPPVVKGDEIWEELAEELGTTPATERPGWTIPGTWKRAKRIAYRLIFGQETLPEVNRVGRIRVTLGHIVEKSTGGQHALENLMPQLNEVNVELSGIYGRKPFSLPLPDGTLQPVREIAGKTITGSLREAIQSGQFTLEEQRAISLWITGTVITPAREAELANLLSQIPALAPLFR